MKMKFHLLCVVLLAALLPYSEAQTGETCLTATCANGYPNCTDMDWGVGKGIDCGCSGNAYGSNCASCFFDESGTWSIVDDWVGTKTRDFIESMVILIFILAITHILLFIFHRVAYKPFQTISLDKTIETLRNAAIDDSKKESTAESPISKAVRYFGYNPIIVDDASISILCCLTGFILFFIGSTTAATFHSGTRLWPYGLLPNYKSCAPMSGWIFSGLVLIWGGFTYSIASAWSVFSKNNEIEDEKANKRAKDENRPSYEIISEVMNMFSTKSVSINLAKFFTVFSMFVLIVTRVVLIPGQTAWKDRSCCERLLTASSDDAAFHITLVIFWGIALIFGLILLYRIWAASREENQAPIETLNLQLVSDTNPWFGWIGQFLIYAGIWILGCYATVLLAMDVAAYMDHHNTAKFEPLLKGYIAIVVATSFIAFRTFYYFMNQRAILLSMQADAEKARIADTDVLTAVNALLAAPPPEKETADDRAHRLLRAKAACCYASQLRGNHGRFMVSGMNPAAMSGDDLVCVGHERPYVWRLYNKAGFDMVD